jgi:hypothetical protein
MGSAKPNEADISQAPVFYLFLFDERSEGKHDQESLPILSSWLPAFLPVCLRNVPKSGSHPARAEQERGRHKNKTATNERFKHAPGTSKKSPDCRSYLFFAKRQQRSALTYGFLVFRNRAAVQVR